MLDSKLTHRFQTGYQLHFLPVELCISDEHKLTDKEAWKEELPTGLTRARQCRSPFIVFTV